MSVFFTRIQPLRRESRMIWRVGKPLTLNCHSIVILVGGTVLAFRT